MDNIGDGLNYIRDRYSDAPGPESGWYDRGGVLPSGVSTVVNATGKSITVYTKAQIRRILECDA